MEQEIYESLLELKKALSEDERIIKLNELEEKLYEDAHVIELAKRKNDIENQYEDVLSYKDRNSPEAKALQKALYEAKLELDNYPAVKEYNSLYIEVRDIYMQIDNIIFGPFRNKTLTSEAK